jgi:hypothetical protein
VERLGACFHVVRCVCEYLQGAYDLVESFDDDLLQGIVGVNNIIGRLKTSFVNMYSRLIIWLADLTRWGSAVF